MANINYTKPNKLENFTTWCLKKYPLWCKSNFPFIEDTFEALDIYSLICKIVQYLNETKQNLNTTEDNVQKIYDFVTNYFDNLDIQKEINNKLDEMSETGILQEIIISYLNSNAVLAFNNVEEMKNAENLIEGSFARTLGYYTINDKGNCLYKIRNRTFDDIIDNGKIILLNNENLVAELIIKSYVTPEMFGAKGDGINDDTNALQKALNSGFKVVTYGIYSVNKTINIYDSIDMMSDSYIKASVDLNPVVCVAPQKQQIGNTYNINVDSNSIATLGVGIGNQRKCIFVINVINAGNTGINCKYINTTGNNENQFSCNVIGNKNGTTEVGVLVNNFDSIFHAIITQDCKYGVKLDGGELIATSIHSWLSQEVYEKLWSESAVIYNVSFYHMQVTWLYQDSVKYGVYGVGPYGHIDFFEANNTLGVSDLYNEMLNVYSPSGAVRLTIDRFVNDLGDNRSLMYSLSENPEHEFGVLNKNGVDSNPNLINKFKPFTDLNLAPQHGSYFTSWDNTNMPIAYDGCVKCFVNCSIAYQIYQAFEIVGTYYVRNRKLTSSTWSVWKKLTLVDL